MESHITFMMGFCVLTNALRARSLAPQPEHPASLRGRP